MKISVCDRCGMELHEKPYNMGLFAKAPRPPKFFGVIPTKSGFNDMWELSRDRIELCQKCTKEFFKFAGRVKR